MLTALPRPNRPRRGVTLVEMLVVVALVVLMMVILVQIFQSATGAMSASRTTQELDVVLRQIDSMLRSDLSGVTAQMTPPNDPARKSGYFEYGENAPADLHGEDTDDFLAFTTKAPEGQVFTGRQWLSKLIANVQTINQNVQPATITSEVAEVIYFWRNGNLYRRVFLVAPQLTTSLLNTGQVGLANGGGFQTSMFGNSLNVSWQGMNDISCRPGGYGPPIPAAGGGVTANPLPPIPNDLGTLTNRENRAFRPRFMNDFVGNANGGPDGIPDDNNADGVPDYYPTLYYSGGTAVPNGGWSPNTHTFESVGYPNGAVSQRIEQGTANSYDVYAFPFIFPGMYSVPDNTAPVSRITNGLGSVHGLLPNTTSGYINHSPLQFNDTPNFTPNAPQTWWGFPTWRETMAGLSSGGGLGWRDPIFFVGNNPVSAHQQPLGLRPIPPNVLPSASTTNLLPPVYTPGTTTAPYGFDGVGSASFVADPIVAGSAESYYPPRLWEDDLILTNVRSFDVKAYDPSSPLYNVTNNAGNFINGPFNAGYLDLGYGAASYVAGPNGLGAGPTNQAATLFQGINAEPVGFGHEGRIPPLISDFRVNQNRPLINVAGNLVPNNLGDSNVGVIRLTHTFDTWSTAYTNAPSQDILLNGYFATSLPIYPSYPPPYPSALRGIQIQIRVVDPRNERSKVLTIRHDFTDKLTN